MTHGYVTCTECDKPRIIYSLKKPSEEQMELLCGYLESVDYSCGDDLFGNLSGYCNQTSRSRKQCLWVY